MVNYNVVTYNVRGIRDSFKRRKIFNYLNDQDHNVIMLQETHSTKTVEKYWASEFGGYGYFDHGTSEARGCAILFKDRQNIQDIIRDIEGRYIIIKVATSEESIAFACIYAPNNDEPEYFRKVFTHIESMNADNVVIGGDFNTVLHSDDIKGGKGNTHPKSTEYITQYCEQVGLTDVWKVRHPDTFRYTWSKLKPYPLMERIDIILVSLHLQQCVTTSGISPAFLSDHSTPYIRIQLDDPLERGKGRWMFNNSLLLDTEYVEQTQEIINEITNDTSLDTFMKWEMVKVMVRGNSIRFGARRKKSNKNKLAALERKLASLEENISQDIKLFTDTQNQRQITLINKDIEEIRAKKTQGAMIRAKAQWFEQGEKPSAYFFRLEKLKGNRKSIQKLETGTETLQENQAIISHIHRFYSKLFQYRDTKIDSDFLNQLVMPQVRPEDHIILDSPILIEELDIAVMQLARDKAPGPDGFSINFMQKFWPQLRHLLHSVLIRADEVKSYLTQHVMG